MYKCLNAPAVGIRGTLSEQVELALLGGFRGLEGNLVEISAIVAERGLSYGRSIFTSAKLQLASWALPLAWAAEDETYQRELQRLPQLAELSQQLGCARALVSIPPASEDRPLHENFEWHRHRLAEIAEILKQYNCRLGLEFNGIKSARNAKSYEFIHTLDATVQLAEAAGTGNVGVVVDAFHCYASGGSINDLQKLSADQIITVQLADAPADVAREELNETQRLLPGETGTIDSLSLLRSVKALGFDGPVTPKPSRELMRSTNRERAIRQTAAALDQIWTQAELTQETA